MVSLNYMGSRKLRLTAFYYILSYFIEKNNLVSRYIEMYFWFFTLFRTRFFLCRTVPGSEDDRTIRADDLMSSWIGYQIVN